ncbi:MULTISPECIES: GGDEF domain-containing protein [Halopseudomonas]|uniref:diguanylate cyclase n=1 Tax=Halopseudomonas bauzanensis TaxID=653930 RepID=A0A031MFT1_9GAMM|nr:MULTISPECIES: diguanylate cyclase [Halopseudomonas]EZQ18278.1 diguanylate cyclase [Halopseudomonas bauzanensis]TKA93001.1 GGDEF domain-containing protein [Halopseudomonas bauzanensis]WGK61534.1 diguanylate cyclase [Halopseudomonas sp. SMJS2]SER82208.1 diguanylate cyclase (GGDEF) domain-containing protein [Halopseudomonas bauzanensis]SFL97055.1 diguanylate cyclase (GGDEF) domain-containing protein [Halopseudomonas bauzanensis]
MSALVDLFCQRLSSLLPAELEPHERVKLLTPLRHPLLVSRQRAHLIVDRVRLFALLFALLTPLWGIVDVLAFPNPLWGQLLALRLLVCVAFFCLLLFYRERGRMADAYLAMFILFAIPTLFYISSHTLLAHYQLVDMPAAVAAGYAFLPFVLMAGLALFPLTLLENLLVAMVLLLAQGIAGYLNWSTLNWPSFVGAFWLLILIAGVTGLACMSQLAFMMALLRQAIRDDLTGVFSRGSGEEILQMQWHTSQRNNSALSLAFIDLDRFKEINDLFGHAMGDQALRSASQHIQNCMRSSDSLVRWGGEEFLLIMPDTDMTRARQAMERLRSSGLGQRPDGLPLTASIGLAERYFDHIDLPQQLLELADQRMYHAKASGRDRIHAL